MNFSFLRLFTLTVVCLALGACVAPHKYTAVDVNLRPDSAEQVSSGVKTSASVLLLEPVIDYTLQSFSNDPVVLPAEKTLIRDAILAGLSGELSAIGFSVVEQPGSVLTPQQNFLSRRLVANYVQLMRLRDFADDPLPTLGPVVNRLSAPGQSDLLVISRYSGATKSAGQHRKDLFIASMRALVSLGMQKQVLLPARYGDLDVALLDGVTGEVLWSAYTAGQPAQLGAMIGRVLETLPSRYLPATTSLHVHAN